MRGLEGSRRRCSNSLALCSMLRGGAPVELDGKWWKGSVHLYFQCWFHSKKLCQLCIWNVIWRNPQSQASELLIKAHIPAGILADCFICDTVGKNKDILGCIVYSYLFHHENQKNNLLFASLCCIPICRSFLEGAMSFRSTAEVALQQACVDVKDGP